MKFEWPIILLRSMTSLMCVWIKHQLKHEFISDFSMFHNHLHYLIFILLVLQVFIIWKSWKPSFINALILIFNTWSHVIYVHYKLLFHTSNPISIMIHYWFAFYFQVLFTYHLHLLLTLQVIHLCIVCLNSLRLFKYECYDPICVFLHM